MSWLKENWGWLVVAGLVVWWLIPSTDTPAIPGDLSNEGGSPTYRYDLDETPSYEDDPYTSNDESNDQDTGYFGTETIEACTTHNGTCYELDADIYDDFVERIYFPNGGWVDMTDGEFDGDYGWGYDETGREWEFSGY